MNQKFSLTVNGASHTITLTVGTYSSIDALVSDLQNKLTAAVQHQTVSNVLTFTSAHGLTTGQEVVYHNGGGSNHSVGGLTDGNTYYVIRINDFSIQLASTPTNALNGNADVTLSFSQAILYSISLPSSRLPTLA